MREERPTEPLSAEPMKINDIHKSGGSQNLMKSQRRRTGGNKRKWAEHSTLNIQRPTLRLKS
jgi:hypothetical protein